VIPVVWAVVRAMVRTDREWCVPKAMEAHY
jgi:hypothetical protein